MVDNEKKTSTEIFRIYINDWATKFSAKKISANDFKQLNIEVKGIVKDNCNSINDSYEKNGQLKNSEFISNNDWKIFDKVFTI